MNAKELFHSSRTLIHSLMRSSQKISKQAAHETNLSPMIFIGSWQLRHSETDRTHKLVIGPDLTISIDHHTIPCKVETLTNDKLVLLDHYGYHITITANEKVPVKLFDEADDIIYYIISNTN
ncbi:DUF4828 domain-containing protein [Secundilactobacillus mixtipabuli]|uniref:DUF4828 domain-containing protein n=1 Tax=Secundilactobacillus mixtipabuli TaxID=1435342 RepID=A0A1Z5IBM5_9LACO|nr:DUF4828 domain-containing protein [Secundilactobacillus mixtipabuli]GAW99173.1 hypothetical protein IWT30_01134 [Secundilactobacillus mixtipabuli]